MKRFPSTVTRQLAALFFATAMSVPTACAQATVYWDVNGDAPGGGPAVNGFYDGTWGVDPFWGSDPSGAVPTGPWTAGNKAVFTAGTDSAADSFITISGTQTASSVLIEDGIVRFRNGTVDTGSGTVTVNAGATL